MADKIRTGTENEKNRKGGKGCKNRVGQNEKEKIQKGWKQEHQLGRWKTEAGDKR